MSVVNQFKSALQQSFTLNGIEPNIVMNYKGNIRFELILELEDRQYREFFDYVEVECFLRNTHFIRAFTQRVKDKLFYTMV